MSPNKMAVTFKRLDILKKITDQLKNNYVLYLFLMPTLIYITTFSYLPMYGVLMAFKRYSPSKGIMGSTWVGFEHFTRFFDSPHFMEVLSNTISINAYSLVISFPVPIILAIMLNYSFNKRFKKIVQTMTYAPHFISMVVLVGMIYVMLSPRSGVVNSFLKLFGFEPVFFMANPRLFKAIYVLSGIWQNTGWSSIIYIAALSNVSNELHEAAIMDGANKLRRIWHIDLPYILPTITILFILSIGRIMNVGFEKVFLMQNTFNISASEVISTYVYKLGLLNMRYDFATAVGLFNNVINFTLLIIFNYFSKRITSNSLF